MAVANETQYGMIIQALMHQLEQMMTVKTYQREIIQRNAQGQWEVRASQLQACQRKLGYSRDLEPKSDSIPLNNLAMMEIGRVSETVCIDILKRTGWEIANLFPENSSVYKWELRPDLVITATPDAYGIIDGVIHLFEFKTRGSQRYNTVVKQGNAKTFPGAVKQLAVYRQAILNNGLNIPMGDNLRMERDTPAAILTLNRESGEHYIEWFRPEVLDEWAADVREDVMHYSWLESGVLPDRIAPNSMECRTCEWRTKCGNLYNIEEEIQESVRAERITEEELAYHFRIWEEQKLLEEKNQIDDTVNKHLRSMLIQYHEGTGYVSIPLRGEQQWEAQIHTNNRDDIDKEALRYYLTPEQYNKVVSPKNTKFVTIKRKRSK